MKIVNYFPENIGESLSTKLYFSDWDQIKTAYFAIQMVQHHEDDEAAHLNAVLRKDLSVQLDRVGRGYPAGSIFYQDAEALHIEDAMRALTKSESSLRGFDPEVATRYRENATYILDTMIEASNAENEPGESRPIVATIE